MNTISKDGSWSAINYKDVSRTGFQNASHLRHLVDMSIAYKKTGSDLKGSERLKKDIDLALDYWLANDFISDNWWWNQIGTPDALVKVLLIMDNDLTDMQIAKIMPIAARATLEDIPGKFYGARESGDRVKIAGILAKRLLFERDSIRFDTVINVIESEIKFATGRGMQYDYSFHHRDDRVNNTLSYGKQFADVFAKWAAIVSGTKYQFSAPSIHLEIDYYLDGICKMLIYGKYPDPGAKNRGISRMNSLRAFSPQTPERLLKASRYRKNELEKIVNIRKGIAQPGLSFSRFYWLSEYFTFQRPDFFTSVRMYSNRDYNMEVPYNGEGLMNHYLGDGANYISRTGKEYDNIWPVYDWHKIPGTTIMQRPEMPSPKDIQKKGLTTFVGAVTDGRYGAVGFDFKSPLDPLKARKAWFFFDKKYVCLGTGISAEWDLPVVTTVNQCLLRGKVITKKNRHKLIMKRGKHVLDKVSWILHDHVGYIFPGRAKVYLSNQAQTGSWHKINEQSNSTKKDIKLDVFKLWFDHGLHPRDASYQYVVVPDTDEKEMTKTAKVPHILVLANTTDIQAVLNTRLHICEAVFYNPGQVKISDNLKLSMSTPGIVMLKLNGNSLQSISVEDPTRKLSKMKLSVSTKIEKQGDNFKADWDEIRGMSNISISLPKTVYAGKSVTIEL